LNSFGIKLISVTCLVLIGLSVVKYTAKCVKEAELNDPLFDALTLVSLGVLTSILAVSMCFNTMKVWHRIADHEVSWLHKNKKKLTLISFITFTLISLNNIVYFLLFINDITFEVLVIYESFFSMFISIILSFTTFLLRNLEMELLYESDRVQEQNYG